MKALRLLFLVLLFAATERTVSTQSVPDRPFLVSSTYWGGSSNEEIATVVVDATGNVYVSGSTSSADFPKTVSTLPSLGATDVFISKFDPAGHLIFSTTFGGSAFDRPNSMAVDAAGNIVIVGDTTSTDLPVVNPIQSSFHFGICGEFGGICGDAFIVKIDPAGQRVLFGTYLGNTRSDSAMDVALDNAGNIYVSGTTESPSIEGVTPLRQFGGARDAFVARIPSAGGALTYFTYLGGSQDESGSGIAVDSAGNAYVTGGTASLDYPTLNPFQAGAENFSQSAFVTKLNAAGAISYSTYLGGHATDNGVDIAVDPTGAAYVVGYTWSTNFPTVHAQQPFLRGINDVFLAKLNASGSTLVYSTYLGGASREQVFLDDSAPGLDVIVDEGGNAYVSGTTESGDFPQVFALSPWGGGQCQLLPFQQTEPCPDAFVTKYDAEGTMVFSTPIGGSDDDRGRGVAVARDGTLYLVGRAHSSNFPIKEPLQATLSGFSDAFIAKISTAFPACQLPPPTLLSPAGAVPGDVRTFSWDPVPGAESYVALLSPLSSQLLDGTPAASILSFGSETSVTLTDPVSPGEYVWLVVPRNSSCGDGRAGKVQFTSPAICPVGAATALSPSDGAVVDNPVMPRWERTGPGVATLSIVILRDASGRLLGQYPAQSVPFQLPILLGPGEYVWVVVTWNSRCGAAVSGPARFRSSGVVP